ncbi:hypothetical protein C6P45_003674 [Maudiozyma exigua]|uniref:Beige protein homolog 1 n=1 Tax=Maudiozyma exigua TaxID=34358 RepID=A0A9P6WEI9_MAUEX|nr:hypothetical protein C6P45_003674 [Kazachstania exigua]
METLNDIDILAGILSNILILTQNNEDSETSIEHDLKMIFEDAPFTIEELKGDNNVQLESYVETSMNTLFSIETTDLNLHFSDIDKWLALFRYSSNTLNHILALQIILHLTKSSYINRQALAYQNKLKLALFHIIKNIREIDGQEQINQFEYTKQQQCNEIYASMLSINCRPREVVDIYDEIPSNSKHQLLLALGNHISDPLSRNFIQCENSILSLEKHELQNEPVTFQLYIEFNNVISNRFLTLGDDIFFEINEGKFTISNSQGIIESIYDYEVEIEKEYLMHIEINADKIVFYAEGNYVNSIPFQYNITIRNNELQLSVGSMISSFKIYKLYVWKMKFSVEVIKLMFLLGPLYDNSFMIPYDFKGIQKSVDKSIFREVYQHSEVTNYTSYDDFLRKFTDWTESNLLIDLDIENLIIKYGSNDSLFQLSNSTDIIYGKTYYFRNSNVPSIFHSINYIEFTMNCIDKSRSLDEIYDRTEELVILLREPTLLNWFLIENGFSILSHILHQCVKKFNQGLPIQFMNLFLNNFCTNYENLSDIMIKNAPAYEELILNFDLWYYISDDQNIKNSELELLRFVCFHINLLITSSKYSIYNMDLLLRFKIVIKLLTFTHNNPTINLSLLENDIDSIISPLLYYGISHSNLGMMLNFSFLELETGNPENSIICENAINSIIKYSFINNSMPNLILMNQVFHARTVLLLICQHSKQSLNPIPSLNILLRLFSSNKLLFTSFAKGSGIPFRKGTINAYTRLFMHILQVHISLESIKDNEYCRESIIKTKHILTNAVYDGIMNATNSVFENFITDLVFPIRSTLLDDDELKRDSYLDLSFFHSILPVLFSRLVHNNSIENENSLVYSNIVTLFSIFLNYFMTIKVHTSFLIDGFNILVQCVKARPKTSIFKFRNNKFDSDIDHLFATFSYLIIYLQLTKQVKWNKNEIQKFCEILEGNSSLLFSKRNGVGNHKLTAMFYIFLQIQLNEYPSMLIVRNTLKAILQQKERDLSHIVHVLDPIHNQELKNAFTTFVHTAGDEGFALILSLDHILLNDYKLSEFSSICKSEASILSSRLSYSGEQLRERIHNNKELDQQKFREKCELLYDDFSEKNRGTKTRILIAAKKMVIDFTTDTQEDNNYYSNVLHKIRSNFAHVHDIQNNKNSNVKWRLDGVENINRARRKLLPSYTCSDHDNPVVSSAITGRNHIGDFNEENITNETVGKDISDESLVSSFSKFELQNENRKILRILKIGDSIRDIWNTSLVVGLDLSEGILILGQKYLYFVSGYYFSKSDGNIVKIEDVPATYRDTNIGLIINRSESQEIEANKPVEVNSWLLDRLAFVTKRPFLLRDVAIEILFDNNTTLFFSFKNNPIREAVYHLLAKISKAHLLDPLYADVLEELNERSNMVGTRNGISKTSLTTKFVNVITPGMKTKNIYEVTELWRKGRISNFYYLMVINTLAGRSFNDLTQYPIFPWVLSDYTSDHLDLSDEQSYRDLSKPMGAQSEKRRAGFIERFNALKTVNDPLAPPFHYGTHYSSAMIVSSFLIRLKPFTDSFVLLQDGSFGHADRLFSSMERTWKSAAIENSTDVRELIPEFFFLPEFLLNINNYNFGTDQRGLKVDDVILPPWSNGDPKIFVNKNREALESPYVSQHLHEWIDLIFGYKQKGKLAEENVNVFNRMSYPGAINLEKIDDENERRALASIIHNFGQIPLQIFQDAHPSKLTINSSSFNFSAMNHLKENPSIRYEKILQEPSSYLTYDKDMQFHAHSYSSFKVGSYYLDYLLERVGSESMFIDGIKYRNLHLSALTVCIPWKNGTFITADVNGLLKIWTIHGKGIADLSLSHKATLHGHLHEVIDAHIYSEYYTLVTLDSHGNVYTWDLISYELINCVHRNAKKISVSSLHGSMLVLTKNDKLVIYNLNSLEYRDIEVPEESHIRSFAFLDFKTTDPYAGHLYLDPLEVVGVGYNDGTVRIFQLSIDDRKNEWQLLQQKILHNSLKTPITSIAAVADITFITEPGDSICLSTPTLTHFTIACGTATGPYPHRSYGNSYPHNYQPAPSANEVPLSKNNIRASNTSENSATIGSSPLSQTTLENHNKSNETVRPSRYNQPVSRKTSVSSSVVSNSSAPGSVSVTRPVNTTVISASSAHNASLGVTASIPTTPSGNIQPTTSRYNSEYHEDVHIPVSNNGMSSMHKPISTGNSVDNNVSSPLTTTHVKSRYSATTPSRYNPYNPNQLPKAQSAYVNPNKTPLQKSHSQQYLSSQRNRPRSVDSTTFEKPYSQNSTTHPTYSNITVEKPSFAVSNSSSTASFFNRGNKWRSHLSHAPSTASSTNDHYPSGQYQNQRSNFWRGTTTKQSSYIIGNEPIPTANRFNTKSANIDPVSVDPLAKQNTTVKEVNEHNKGVRLSPRSSLIRSVPQTTRETTKQTPINHRNYDLQRSRANTPLSSGDDIETETNESESEIILPSIDTKYELEKLQPKSNDLWTVEQTKETITSMPTTSDSREEERKPEIDENNKQVVDVTDKEMLKTDELAQVSENEESKKFGYEYVSDPAILKTDVSKLTVPNTSSPFTVKFPQQEKCIFPLNRVETKLWELKYKDRSYRIARQKYLLKNPIVSFKEYSFFKRNIANQKHIYGPRLLETFKTIKKFERMHIVSLNKLHDSFKESWEKDCKKMEEVNSEVRKDEIEYKKKEYEKKIEKEEQEKHQEEHSNSSRRRNRADFVDDTEMESVMLQIDPDYKHVQAAAVIPDLQLNVLNRHSRKFKNVNNLFTDKDKWASRLLTDGIDNFSEHEHELFLEGYLTHPKKFGKISHHMGGLRTPEECVLHYYRTKRNVDYKELLVQKNKKRKSNAAAKRRSKKKEKIADSNESFVEHNESSRQSSNDTVEKDNVEELPILEPATIETDSVTVEKEDNTPKMEQVIVNVEKVNPVESVQIENVVQKETVVEDSGAQPDKDIIVADGITDQTVKEPVTKNVTNHPIVKTVSETTIESNTNEPVAKEKEEDAHEQMLTTAEPDVSVTQQTAITSSLLPGSIENVGNDEIVIPKKRIFDNSEQTNQPIETSSNNITLNEHMIERPGTLEAADEYYDSDGTRKKQRIVSDHKSSYWSVKESQAFPELLERYGSQWTLISEELATKSTTMVRNYYQRNAAQYGWKSIVEDTDLRRNAGSSDSVQQTQILIQPEQQPVMNISNGIPMQQKPTLGFFSNPTEHRIVSTDSTSGQTFNVVNDGNRDSFSNASTPTATLPAPILPSIQLNPNSIGAPQRQAYVTSTEQVTGNNGIPTPSKHNNNNNNRMNFVQKESSTRTSIANLMNNDSGLVTSRAVPLTGRSTANVGPPLIPSASSDDKMIANVNPTPSRRMDLGIRNFLNNPVPEESNTRTVPQPTSGPSNPMVSPLNAPTGTSIISDHKSNVSKPINGATDGKRIVVQDMNVPPQYSNAGSSHPRLSSISSLLNPVSSMQPRSNLPPLNYNNVNMIPQRGNGITQQKVAVPDFNFANDPLAALAAVASAPETLASIANPRQNPNRSQSK